jgi:hypothetical protein
LASGKQFIGTIFFVTTVSNIKLQPALLLYTMVTKREKLRAILLQTGVGESLLHLPGDHAIQVSP